MEFKFKNHELKYRTCLDIIHELRAAKTEVDKLRILAREQLKKNETFRLVLIFGMNDIIDSCKVTGDIRLDGEDIYARDVDPVVLRRRVGMVFQKPNPFPKSIFENVAYAAHIHGLAEGKDDLQKVVKRSLIRAGLWEEVKDRLDAPATGLSGGQQQRLCIARAIAIEPDVILMDEPCSALDPIATAKIEELINELKTNYTIVIVTHSMQQAARVSQHTAFFHMGELVEEGETKVIFTNPKDPRTEAYVTGRIG